jgi:SEC-C motif-containing protein/uncharacterized protein DUF5677
VPKESVEDVRRQIKERYRAELAACDFLLEVYESRASPWSGRPVEARDHEQMSPDEIIVMELSRSRKSYEASIDLAQRGFGEQAAMINRSLFEGMAVAHWVHSHESEAMDRFNRAARLHDHLYVERIRNAGWLDEEEVARAAVKPLDDDDLKALNNDFGRYGEFMWTGHSNMRNLISEIEDQWESERAKKELWTFFKIAHHDNNQLLHSTVSGMARSLVHRDREGIRVWNGPATTSIDKALFGAYFAFLNLLTLGFDRFELKGREELDEMVKEHQFVFVRLTDADKVGVQRNDPCPCGSGKKFKKCHEDRATSG